MSGIPLPCSESIGVGSFYDPSRAYLLSNNGNNHHHHQGNNRGGQQVKKAPQPRTSPVAHFASTPNDGIGNDSLVLSANENTSEDNEEDGKNSSNNSREGEDTDFESARSLVTVQSSSASVSSTRSTATRSTKRWNVSQSGKHANGAKDGDANNGAAGGGGGDRGIPTAGRLLAINSRYVAYAVKKGLVRVIDRRTASKILLRGHSEGTRIVDASFFGNDGISQEKEGVAGLWNHLAASKNASNTSSNSSSNTSPSNANSNVSSNTNSNISCHGVPPAASDVLATIGGMNDEACVLVWRIYFSNNANNANNVPNNDTMGAEKLLELRYPPACRILWHPFNPNRFLLLHRNINTTHHSQNNNNNNANNSANKNNAITTHRCVATLVETTRLVTQPHYTEGHAVCHVNNNDNNNNNDDDDAQLPGASPFIITDRDSTDLSLAGANDVSWSHTDARFVLTAHDDGMVRLWDVALPVAPVPYDTRSMNIDGTSEASVGNLKDDGLLSIRCVSSLDVAAPLSAISYHHHSASQKRPSWNVIRDKKRVTRVLFLSRYVTDNQHHQHTNGHPEQNDIVVTPPFLTGTDMNHTITLWSSFTTSIHKKVYPLPQPLRVFGLRYGSHSLTTSTIPPPTLSSMLTMELCPAPYRPPVPSNHQNQHPSNKSSTTTTTTVPSSFVLLGERNSGYLHALHLDTEWNDESCIVKVKGFDQVTTLNVVHPPYSFCVAPSLSSSNNDDNGDNNNNDNGGGTNMLSQERDVDLCCVQSKAIQMLTLSAAMMTTTTTTSNESNHIDDEAQQLLAPGVTLIKDFKYEEPLEQTTDFEEEEYDMEEINMDDDDEEEEQQPYDMYQDNHQKKKDVTNTTTSPLPEELDANHDPFANWLGAIANPPTTSATSVSLSSGPISASASGLATTPSSRPTSASSGLTAATSSSSSSGPTPTSLALTSVKGKPSTNPPPGLSFPNNAQRNNNNNNNISILPPPPGLGAPSGPMPGMTFLSPMQLLNNSNNNDNNNAPNNANAPNITQPQGKPLPSNRNPGMIKEGKSKKSTRTTTTTANPSSLLAPSSTIGKKKKSDAVKSVSSHGAPVTILRRDDSKHMTSSNTPNTTASNTISTLNASNKVNTSNDIAPVKSSNETTTSPSTLANDKELLSMVRTTISSEINTIFQNSQFLGNRIDRQLVDKLDIALEKPLERALENTLESRLEIALEKHLLGSELEETLGRRLDRVAKESAKEVAIETVKGMQVSIVSSLHQTMKEITIPAYEAATRQMFQQISQSVEQGFSQLALKQSDASAPALEAITRKLNLMSETINSLSSEVTRLRESQTNNDPPPPPTRVDVRTEILTAVQTKRYEEAFTKAVSASDGDIVVFACRNADISSVFSNGEAGANVLSQPILICLMQQLGAVLVSSTDREDLKTELAWLQEIAVTIDPTDESIQRHVGSVVNQLLANINTKMTDCDHSLRRPLQMLMQVVRGLL